uniref:VQ motif-containing protein 25 n=1 Tax=Elaeis guineensis var. tenera TaxID=51953 RepID=A0A6I9QM42_ELAGV|nr:VQ motif-containing protein 25 [Elaeis guineensis]
MASAVRAPLMDDIMSQQACERPATLALRKDSHMISKMKPKIRIVHIFAPEIIQTDVENFRELVQRLTGKPTKRNGGKKAAAPAVVDSTESMGMRRSYRDSWVGERVKGELEVEKRELRTEGTSGGFLSTGGFGDVDGIFQGLGDFPSLPLSASHVDGIGEAQVS